MTNVRRHTLRQPEMTICFSKLIEKWGRKALEALPRLWRASPAAGVLCLRIVMIEKQRL